MMGLFDDNSRDTFRLSGKEFHIGWQTLHLNPQVKREATICNLFANHGLAVTDIIRILDENYENVIAGPTSATQGSFKESRPLKDWQTKAVAKSTDGGPRISLRV